MDAFLKDLKHAARMSLQTPSVTVTAIAALALGIAANTAIFSVVSTVLLKPFAYSDPGRIVMFQNTFRGGAPDRQRRAGGIQLVAAAYRCLPRHFGLCLQRRNLTGEAFPEQIPTISVSANFFRLCGANALRGRTFTVEDDAPNSPKTVVLVLAAALRQ